MSDPHPFILRGDAATKIVSGQATTVTASDTIQTGLRRVVAVVAAVEEPLTDPDNPALRIFEPVTASIGDQAGAPDAGSFLLKTWKNIDDSNQAAPLATTFGQKVNWIAFGY
jgi:hypothetical protein